MVGLGGLEPPTSSLSGMRSSHLSYRPRRFTFRYCALPYTWWSWSGSNRRPPECKSGALPAELQPLKKSNRGQLDAVDRRDRLPATKNSVAISKWRSEAKLISHAEARPTVVEWNGYFLLAHAVHSSAFGFPKLHPRSLLERR